MDKRPQLSVNNKTDLMPNNASCKRWDTPGFSSPPLRFASYASPKSGESFKTDSKYKYFQRIVVFCSYVESMNMESQHH